MSEFDSRAGSCDDNPVHWKRSEAIAKSILKIIPVHSMMNALEYGAGTGILSFLLANDFSEITMMDNSAEMVRMMNEKLVISKISNLKALLFDLEHSDYAAGKFDCIFTQMVLHHVSDVSLLLGKFTQLLNPGGYLAIADLYAEDGSFHGPGFEGHNGFDVVELQKEVEKTGLKHITTEQCFTVKKSIDGEIREFPVFLMVAQK